MKKLLTISLSIVAGFALAIALVGSTIHVRAGGNSTASANGDVNGDGTIDIADAVYTLLYLFKGGEPPVACAGSPDLVGRVQALEDTNTQIANSLEEIAHPCRHRADRFVDNGNATVTDTCSGLMWMKRTADVDSSGTIGDCGDRLTWQAATDFAANLQLVGQSDWRLPSFEELEGLLRVSGYGVGNIAVSPAASPVFGIVGGSSAYWTSTSDVLSPGDAWTVAFMSSTNGPPTQTPRSKNPSSCSERYLILAVRGP
jgi:hypothetical protein